MIDYLTFQMGKALERNLGRSRDELKEFSSFWLIKAFQGTPEPLNLTVTVYFHFKITDQSQFSRLHKNMMQNQGRHFYMKKLNRYYRSKYLSDLKKTNRSTGALKYWISNIINRYFETVIISKTNNRPSYCLD